MSCARLTCDALRKSRQSMSTRNTASPKFTVAYNFQTIEFRKTWIHLILWSLRCAPKLSWWIGRTRWLALCNAIIFAGILIRITNTYTKQRIFSPCSHCSQVILVGISRLFDEPVMESCVAGCVTKGPFKSVNTGPEVIFVSRKHMGESIQHSTPHICSISTLDVNAPQGTVQSILQVRDKFWAGLYSFLVNPDHVDWGKQREMD